MTEIVNLGFEGATVALLTLIVFRLRRIEKDLGDHDRQQRKMKSSVDELAGKMQVIERVTFPAMVREFQERKQQ